MDNKQFFLNRYRQLGGTIADVQLKKSLRVNTLKISYEQFAKRMSSINVSLTKIPFAKDGYYAEAKFSLGAITEYLLGYYYLQEAAAQLPAQILNPQPNDVVLDMCAAPGGKTTQLAQIMQNKGVIVAVEQKEHRLESLKNNLERMGVENCIVYKTNALGLQIFRIPPMSYSQMIKSGGIREMSRSTLRACRMPQGLNEEPKATSRSPVVLDKSTLKFDKILLDAPCAGNYATDNRWFQKRDIDGIQRSSQIQKELLSAAMHLLKKNGTLVYSTCSLEPEENELNINWMLKKFDVKIEELNLTIGDEGLVNVFGQKLNPEIKKCRRFWPHKTNTEGFFIAKVLKC